MSAHPHLALLTLCLTSCVGTGSAITDGAQALDGGPGDAGPASSGLPDAGAGGSDAGGSDAGGSGAGGSDAGVSDAGGSDAADAGPATTRAGVPLPAGWTLKISDRFGTAPSQTVSTFSQLHGKYEEGQVYNRNPDGGVRLPNVVINHEQETYVHFEDALAFGADHLAIRATGQPDAAIWSGELVSRHAARSWCVEARYTIPAVDKAWPAFWFYGDAEGNDASEVDVEQPLTPNQGVHQISLHNHPAEGTVQVVDARFTTQWMTWSDAAFDASAAPHDYTACYDDGAALLTRYLDGQLIYSAGWKWNASLGGTGHGPGASAIVNLAVGGDWPGDTSSPASYSAELKLYSLEWYEP